MSHKIKCVNNIFTNRLTVGKVYGVLKSNEETYLIVDDNGDRCEYHQARFEDYIEEIADRDSSLKINNDTTISDGVRDKNQNVSLSEAIQYQDVLILDYFDVLGKVVVKLVYKNENFLPTRDDEFGYRFSSRCNSLLFDIGRRCISISIDDNNDNNLELITEEQSKLLKHRVEFMNRKYGRIKEEDVLTSSEIIAKYPTHNFRHGDENTYFALIEKDGEYDYRSVYFSESKYEKCYSCGNIHEMIEELNDLHNNPTLRQINKEKWHNDKH